MVREMVVVQVSKQSMESCEVLILYSHELFASGLERLLRDRGLGLASADLRSGDIVRLVRSMRPRLVLMEDDDDNVFATKLSRILKGSRDIRVIRISTQNNRMNIYSSRQVLAVGPEDLFDAIEDVLRVDPHEAPGQGYQHG